MLPAAEAILAQSMSTTLTPIPLVVELNDAQSGDGIEAYSDGENIWLPVRQLASLFEIPIEVNPEAQRVEGWLFEPDRRWRIRIAGGLARGPTDSDWQRFPENAFVTRRLDSRRELHVRPMVLEAVWPIRIGISRADLRVTIRSRRKLPRERRLEREAERAALNQRSGRQRRPDLPRTGTDYHWWQPPGGTLRIGSSRTGDGRTESQASLTAVGEIAGMTAFTTAAARRDANGSTRLGRGRLTLRRFASPAPMTLGAREIAFGDLRTAPTERIAGGQTGVGFGMSSFPLRSGSSLEGYSLAGDAQPGSEVELYRGDSLVGFTEVDEDGRYQFGNITLEPGPNPLRVIIRTPEGRRLVEQRRPVFGRDQINPGETRFALEGVRPGTSLIANGNGEAANRAAVGGLRIATGVDERTTVNLRWIRGMGREATTRRDYVGVDMIRGIGLGILRLGMLSDLAGGQLLDGDFRLPTRQWPVTAGVAVGNGYQSPATGFGDEAITQELSLRTNQRVRLAQQVFRLSFNAQQRESRDGSSQRILRLRQSARLAGLRWRHRINWRAGDTIDGALLFSDWLNPGADRRMRLSGQLRYRRGVGVASLAVSTRVALANQQQISGQLAYDRETDESRWTIAYNGNITEADYSLGATITDSGDFGISASLQFAFATRRGRSPTLFETNPVAEGRLRARAYIDANGNGRRDTDEQALGGVRLQPPLSNKGATDARGELAVNGLSPHRYYPVRVDPASLQNPLQRPAKKGERVWVRPGSTPRVSLAVKPTGGVYGNVRYADENEGAQGVGVRLVNCGGEVVARRRTRLNGFFAFEGLPLERLWLRVDNRGGLRMSEVPGSPLALSPDAPYVSEQGVTVTPRSTLDEYGAVQGTLIAPDCADGLANVALRLQPIDDEKRPYRISTGMDGHFQLDRLPFGRYRLSVVESTLPDGIETVPDQVFELTPDAPLIEDRHLLAEQKD